MKIEVTWKALPASGITQIELSDLGCKTKKEWDSLSKPEQETRLNEALVEYDGYEVKPKAIEW